jgi:hypothetical protein
MEGIETQALTTLKAATATSDLVNIIAASQTIHSEALYKQALGTLVESKPSLNIEQSRLIGLDALQAVYAHFHDTGYLCRKCKPARGW